MMERGAIVELIPDSGSDGAFSWQPFLPNPRSRISLATLVTKSGENIALFYGPHDIRLERVALFLTTEQS